MSIELQPRPRVPLVTLVKTEPLTVIKKEPLEEALEEDINSDIKDDIDIVYHPLSEVLIKSETVLEDILENKHLESVQTQALVVKAENSPFVKTENITQRNKSEDTSVGNVSRGTGQGMVVVQASNEHSNALSNLEIDKQSVLNFSKDLNSISVRSRKFKSPKKTDFAECYKTDNTTLRKKEKEKIKVIEAPMIPVEAHEYISLTKDTHVCNHCQQTYKKLKYIKPHIKRMHREVTTMYQCTYCSYESKWRQCINQHITSKHKDTKDIQWFQCNLCEKKFKLKGDLTKHKKVHLIHEKMQDGLDLRSFRYGCNECDYKTYTSTQLKSHKLTHLKPEEIQYFYCYHCSYKFKRRSDLRIHIFRHHFKNVTHGKRFGCNKCNYKTYSSTALKNHKLTHLNPEEIEYFYCYHCSYKVKQKWYLKRHIFSHHFENVKQGKRHYCDRCDYKTCTSTNLKNHKLTHLNPEEIEYFYCCHCSYKAKQKWYLKRHVFSHHFENVKQGKRHYCDRCDYKTCTSTNLKNHKLTHLKPDEIQYFYCYHCSYKDKRKSNLKGHIFSHFRNENVPFHCYICDFVTQKRDLIIEHIRKHFKNRNKYDETITKYQLESRINNLKKKVSK